MELSQTCGRRMTELGPWEHEAGLDKWQARNNGDLCCSFCGSMHPEKVLELAKKVVSGEDTVTCFHMSDKGYKLYIDQSGVQNAEEGGIKFYTHHIPDEGAKEWLEVVNQAIKISHGRIFDRHSKPQRHY